MHDSYDFTRGSLRFQQSDDGASYAYKDSSAIPFHGFDCDSAHPQHFQQRTKSSLCGDTRAKMSVRAVTHSTGPVKQLHQCPKEISMQTDTSAVLRPAARMG